MTCVSGPAAKSSRRTGRIIQSLSAPEVATRSRRSLRLLWVISVVSLAAICSAASAQGPSSGAKTPALPDAPSAQNSTGSSSSQADSGAISGTVLSQSGAEVPDARVVLENSAGAPIKDLRASSSGAFLFNDLPAGKFRISASGDGWGTYVSPPVTVAAGDFQIVTGIVLPVTTSTSVRVYASPDALAEQQVQIAVQQRVLGVFPNFYSAYDWNAPPMHSKQKFQLAVRSLIDPLTIADAAGIAGAEQYVNRFPGFGTGPEAYLKRFGAAYADAWSGRMFSEAIFPSVFHQDPRYFYRGTGSTRSRALYALSAAVIARGDKGNWEPNYSRIFGTFAASAASNLYYPPENRGGSLIVGNALIAIGSDAAMNVVREFVLQKITTRAHSRGH